MKNKPHTPHPKHTLTQLLAEDLQTIVDRDPSTHNRTEALWHPALPALWAHRLAHPLYHHGRRHTARTLAALARIITGIEIHPAATIGRRVFIDHGAAVVIGETAILDHDITLYQQVTLGALGWWHDNHRPPGQRRHPHIQSGVILGTNATLLGPITIGNNTTIGAQTLITHDIPPNTRIHAPTPHTPPTPTPTPTPHPMNHPPQQHPHPTQ